MYFWKKEIGLLNMYLGVVGVFCIMNCYLKCLYWKIQVATLFQNSKIPEDQMSPTTPSKKQSGISKKLYP